MAEGVQVEIPRSAAQKYFCHSCVSEVTARYPDLKCAQCQSDFIEEVPECPDESDDSDFDINTLQELSRLVHEEEYPIRRLIRRTILQTIFDFDQRETQNFPPRSFLGEWIRFRGGRDDAAAPSSGREEADDDGLDLFAEFLRLDANLGDYAFGYEWDSIITQILNESDVSGPPPLSREEIEAIPMIAIQEEHVIKDIQCTVCMENFQMNEKVKNLPCEHFFHEECIVPWLKMHATCPICRKQIDGKIPPNYTPRVTLFDDDSSSTSSNSSSSSSSNSTTTSDESSSSTDDSSASESTVETSTRSRRSSTSSSSVDLSPVRSLFVHPDA